MTFRAASSDYQDADTSAPAKPTGTVDTDTVILIANCGGSTSATFTWPAGFAATVDSVGTGAGGYDRTIGWSWKRAGASEPSTYSVTSSINGTLSVVALSYSGMAVSPVDDFDKGFTNTAAGSPLTITPAGLVTTVANATVLWVAAPNYQISNNTPSPGTTIVTQPSGHTTRITQMGDYAAIVVSDITQVSLGASGSLAGSASNNQGQNGTWAAFSIALAPTGGGVAAIAAMLRSQQQNN